MGRSHDYYEPTEYEQMLIAAGWVTPESLDMDYQEYTSGNRDAVSYSTWQHLRRQWDELNEQYEKNIAPYYRQESDMTIPYEMVRLEKQLLGDMSDIEVTLGY